MSGQRDAVFFLVKMAHVCFAFWGSRRLRNCDPKATVSQDIDVRKWSVKGKRSAVKRVKTDPFARKLRGLMSVKVNDWKNAVY